MLISPQLHKEIEAIKENIKDEYRQPHDKEWIVGFSGGKDSTLMLHLVVESILEIPWSQRKRPIHVVANDTLVESPIVQGYVNRILAQLKVSLNDLDLPFIVQKTVPGKDQTFWVNLIGRGYPAPTRMFRWCTDRLKIRPTTSYIRDKISQEGEVILLLGVRRSESAARAKSASRYDNGGRLNRHNDIQGCWVFRPILELDTEDVWEFVLGVDSPWGDSHAELVRLYKDAAGGECPLVIDPDSAPSCGSSSIRFGCWTCTVVKKDKSFRNAMEKEQYASLEPMADFRDWLREYCYEPEHRMPMRRNGQDGPGPLTFDARKEVLSSLLELQEKVEEDLISDVEMELIEKIWLEDKSQMAVHQANRLLNLMESI
ncbi:DNA phosphorothioation system sulfurtransferase DndC [Pseudodesulfovibrio thermohalotolerans]|uniref:DNA phosphorothioation system sulfurtransferase DndC n=1 Tax=Pseudodesulfovibrio thermohalotolerans TaxID=2880651 RepID=UPI002441F90E|nr:DNA phosphorothioation system sulfurtransferase DndC [Pseudodesulfovibrio thermohalotolerans]WFS63395.1 DNA phosphorothioation system sulfurtransferase DndC [Pseudodesulfovibrio thermohalotolerans]